MLAIKHKAGSALATAIFALLVALSVGCGLEVTEPSTPASMRPSVELPAPDPSGIFSDAACVPPPDFPQTVLATAVDSGVDARLTDFAYHNGRLFLRARKTTDWNFSPTQAGAYLSPPTGDLPTVAITPVSRQVSCWHDQAQEFSILVTVGFYQPAENYASIDFYDATNRARLRVFFDTELPRLELCPDDGANCRTVAQFLGSLTQSADTTSVDFKVGVNGEWPATVESLAQVELLDRQGQTVTTIYPPGYSIYSYEIEAAMWQTGADEIGIGIDLQTIRRSPLIDGRDYTARLWFDISGGGEFIHALHEVPFTYAGPAQIAPVEPSSAQIERAQAQIRELGSPDAVWNLMINAILSEDYGDDRQIWKWNRSTVRVCYPGDASELHVGYVEGAIALINATIGSTLLLSDPQATGCELEIRFLSEAEWLTEADDDSLGLNDYTTVRLDGVIDKIKITVRRDYDYKTLVSGTLKGTVLHELMHAVGFHGHNCRNPSSILYQCSGTQYQTFETAHLIGSDVPMLQLLYNPLIEPGMTATEVLNVYNQATGANLVIPDWIDSQVQLSD